MLNMNKIFGYTGVQKSKVIDQSRTFQPLAIDFLLFNKKDRLNQLI